MNSEYILRINADKEKYNTLSSLLEVMPTSTKVYWELSINESSNLFTKAINYYLELIENNFEKLNQIGIKKEDLSIWYLYEYEEQCNMEFQPDELMRLGNNGISLCISCWKKYE
jgi:hypothetical protein